MWLVVELEGLLDLSSPGIAWKTLWVCACGCVRFALLLSKLQPKISSPPPPRLRDAMPPSLGPFLVLIIIVIVVIVAVVIINVVV